MSGVFRRDNLPAQLEAAPSSSPNYPKQLAPRSITTVDVKILEGLHDTYKNGFAVQCVVAAFPPPIVTTVGKASKFIQLKDSPHSPEPDALISNTVPMLAKHAKTLFLSPISPMKC